MDFTGKTDDELRSLRQEGRQAAKDAEAELLRRHPQPNPRFARRGGTFAPPLTDEKLDEYGYLIDQTEEKSRLREILITLHACVKQWWGLPESKGAGSPHPSGRGTMVPLDKPVAESLWDAIPWTADLNTMQAELDALPAGPLRNAAFHLLWFVKELDLDREPITADKL